MGAVVIHLVAQGSSLLFGASGLSNLRLAYSNDQLGYMTIAANVRVGIDGNPEPVTLTGVNNYPRDYYTIVGLVARIFHLQVVQAWNFTAIAVQVVMIAVLAALLIRLTGRNWAGLLAPTPFVAGIGAWLISGSWMIHLGSSHATLWGPFGVLFSLNGEAAGISCVIISVCLVIMTWDQRISIPKKRVLRVIAALLIGMIAGFQTYSFLTGCYLLAFVIAVVGLYEKRSRISWISSAALVLVVFLIGPLISEHIGQLPTLVFGLIIAVPGLWLHLRIQKFRWIGYLAITAVLACFQVIPTLVAQIGGDPFLHYRVASNQDLGVVYPLSLVVLLFAAIPLLFCLRSALSMNSRHVVGISLGSLVTLVMVATNNVWGPNTEPYRMALDGLIYCFVAIPVCLAMLSGAVSGIAASGAAQIFSLPATDEQSGKKFLAAVVAGITMFAIGLPDFFLFATSPSTREMWDSSAAEPRAVQQVLTHMDTSKGLLLTDPCADPRTTKVLTSVPVNYYFLGMAWPERRDAVQQVMDDRTSGIIQAGHLHSAGVGYVMTQSSCQIHWQDMYPELLEKVASAPVAGTEESYTLWSVR
ncbi:hypothetical protein [Propionibacterium sp.]|uniref:hypothetical protein n=1 Tax=Propionibacterium sp. TaxID=1977903 RepID=UPI0039ECC5D9